MAKAQILIVEDDNIVVMELRDRLQSLGYAVAAVASYGEEAIEKAAETRPDLVLMDIRLKGDIDGVEAAQEIRTRFDIPVIYLTAYADENTLQRAKITEPYGYIIKPFEEGELRSTIEMVLYRHKIERKLKESERWLATTLRSIGDAVITIDEKGLVTFMNPVAEALTGWKQEDALGRDLTEVFKIVNEETGILAESPVTKALREGVTVGLANHSILIAKDGTETPIDENAAPIRDDKGKVIGVVLVFRDITERRQEEEALRESEERYRSVVEHSHAGVFLVDGAYRFIYVNDELCRILGYSREEIVGQDFRRFLDDESEQLVADRYVRRQRGEEVAPRYEFNIVRKDGEKRRVEISSAVIKDSAGKVKTVAQILDITERKQAEEEIQQRALQLEALSEVSRVVSSSLDLDTVLQLVLEQLARVIPYDSMALWLRSEDTLHVAAARGFPNIEEILKLSVKVEDNSLFQAVEREKSPLVIADTHQDSRFLALGETDYVRSWIGVPLMVKDRVIGTITIDKWEPYFYHEGHVQMAVTLANQAAIAIENARLYESEQTRRRVADTLREVSSVLSSTLALDDVLHLILEQLENVVTYDTASVAILHGDVLEISATRGYADTELVVGVRLPLAESAILRQMMRGKEAVVITDVREDERWIWVPGAEHVRSWLGVPLLVKDRMVGALMVDRVEPNFYSLQDAQLVFAFANQAAIAIENARLFEETRKRMEQTQLLLRVSEATASALDSTEVMRHIAREAARVLGADMIGAYLLDETGKNLQAVAGYHVPPERQEMYREFRIPAEGHPFVEEAWRSQRAIFTNDMAGDSRFDEETSRLFRARSVLLTPMIIKDTIIGGLWAVWWEEAHHFTEEEQRLIEGIVRQAAIALENARLYEQVTSLAEGLEVRVQKRTEELAHRAQELSSLFQASVALSSSLEVEGVLQALAQQAVLAVDAVDCTICELQDDALVVAASYSGPALPWQDPEIGRRYLLADYPATREVIEKWRPLRIRVDDSLADEAERAELQELGYTALLQVPIVSRDQVLGIVEVFDNKPEREFSESNAALLQTIANQAGMAIEKARLFQQVREERNHLELLYEVSRKLSASLDLDQTLHDIFQVSVAATGASRGSIFVFDDEGRVAHRILMRDLSPAEAEDAMDRALRKGLAGWVLEHKQSAIVFDTSRDERWLPFPDDPEPVGSAMVIPFIERDQVRGLLTLVHPQPSHFSQIHLELLSSIAQQVAVVIERARLHEHAQRRAVQLATAAEVSRDATSILDVGQLLTRTVDLIRERFDLYYAGIFLVDEAGQYAVLQAGTGEAGRQMLKRGHKLQVGSVSMVGQCVANAQACIALDVGKEAIRFDNPLLPETRTEMALPLISLGRVIGAMTVQSDQPAAFSDEDVTALQTVADQLANAIENARLYEEARRRAQEVAQQKEQTDTIVQSMADGLIVTDLENRLVLANPAAEELLKFRLEDAIGREIGANIRDDRLRQIVRDTLDKQQAGYEVDIELTDPYDGAKRIMRAHTAGVNDPFGQSMGIVTTLRDVTHEREVQRLKDELVSTVSHELRTPMTSVLGFSELLVSRQLSEEKRQLYAQTIHKEAQRLSALINDFLDLQRMERGQQEYHFEEVDLGELAREAVATYSGHSEAHTLTLDMPTDLPLVQADPDRLKQVFGNLLSNAIKFSPDGGTVTVSVQAEGDEVHIAVSDEGIGIPAEAMSHLFEKFFRVDSSDRREIKGTGLGLAICKGIVEAHRGRVWAESQVGTGTTIIVSLPMMARKRILVIDDEKDIREMFQRLLSERDCEVLTAANGQEGLSLIEAELPDLVIVDIAMPVMNGYQFLENMKGDQRTRDIPVIAISGVDTDIDKLKELGMDEFLSKPFSSTVLLETMRRLLKGS
jgi:PAS domain S-box-containing protein